MPSLRNSCAECYAGTAAAGAARHTRRGRAPFPQASLVACPIGDRRRPRRSQRLRLTSSEGFAIATLPVYRSTD